MNTVLIIIVLLAADAAVCYIRAAVWEHRHKDDISENLEK